MTQLADRFRYLAALRDSRPVFLDQATGRWFVLRYDNVSRLLSEPQHFAPDPHAAAYPTLHTVHVDQHALRATQPAVVQILPAQILAALSPHIAMTVQQQLADLRPTGSMDAIDDLALPLAAAVFTDLLGLAAEEHTRVCRWIDRVIWADMSVNGVLLPDGTADAQRALQELAGALLPVVIARRRQPQGDLISRLLSVDLGGAALSDDEVVGCCRTILVAGAATMTHLLGSAVLCLTEHPAVMAQLRRTPAPVYSTIEEILRYLPPVWYVSGTTTTAITLGGQAIPAHAEVWASLATANRDPARFDDPDRFNIERIPNRHLSFGPQHQPVVDAALARQVTSTLLLQLAALPDLRSTPRQSAELAESATLIGIKHLPVIWNAPMAEP